MCPIKSVHRSERGVADREVPSRGPFQHSRPFSGAPPDTVVSVPTHTCAPAGTHRHTALWTFHPLFTSTKYIVLYCNFLVSRFFCRALVPSRHQRKGNLCGCTQYVLCKLCLKFLFKFLNLAFMGVTFFFNIPCSLLSSFFFFFCNFLNQTSSWEAY